ncbi:universal stress protein [Aeoliella mucimassa]|uniref:Universal stress protein G n=1 Tax=Aeoliella mucimassa TaxID=2527972 RepID=A0A518AKA9_9BACT|nr:universal stress protein [Aeoliella mucimassa]QDU55126.1 Universal stress protein G [Aeoliella mucimassa]
MKNWFMNKKVLVPVDFSEESMKAVDDAIEMADTNELVHVVHVAPDLDVTTPGVVWESISEDVQREHVLKTFAKTFASPKYDGVSYHVAFGDAGRGIVKHAEQIDADVIVMPSHGRAGFRRLLLGSVAERVLRLAHLPVLVLRH